MARLAEEVCDCKAQLLSGGLSGNNAAAIITHLWEKQPVLIPYPPGQTKKNGGDAFNQLIFEKGSSMAYTDMMRTSTMSHASGGVIGHTGPLFQVSLVREAVCC